MTCPFFSGRWQGAVRECAFPGVMVMKCREMRLPDMTIKLKTRFFLKNVMFNRRVIVFFIIFAMKLSENELCMGEGK